MPNAVCCSYHTVRNRPGEGLQDSEMSSFKRRVTSTPIPGTRPSAYNSLPLLSTGLTSLDDILGGGLPLSSLLLLEADTPTAYAELLLKFWIAQGLECKQGVVVVGSALDSPPDEIVRSLPGVDGASTSRGESEDEDTDKKGEKMKIAFRYEGMKQHATTVKEPVALRSNETDVYCTMFDLTTTKPLRAADHARLHLIDVEELSSSSDFSVDLYELLYRKIEDIIVSGGYSLPQDSAKPRRALRIALSSIGSPSWGSTTPSSLYSFCHRLRALLRRSSASCILTFPSHLYATSFPSLVSRLSHASDGVISLVSFASSPVSFASFPRHNGIIKIPKLPSLGSLVPPSAKLSVLRGLGGSDGMENNLGFRVKRRRFIIETVNGDGPVGGESEEKKKVDEKVEKVEAKKHEEKESLSGDLKATKVRFMGEDERSGTLGKEKKVSVSRLIHSKPEMFEF